MTTIATHHLYPAPTHLELIETLCEATGLEGPLGYKISEYCDHVPEGSKIKGLFFKIRDQDGHEGYVLGTIHMGPKDNQVVIWRVNEVLKKTKVIAFEYDTFTQVNKALLAEEIGEKLGKAAKAQFHFSNAEVSQVVKNTPRLYPTVHRWQKELFFIQADSLPKNFKELLFAKHLIETGPVPAYPSSVDCPSPSKMHQEFGIEPMLYSSTKDVETRSLESLKSSAEMAANMAGWSIRSVFLKPFVALSNKVIDGVLQGDLPKVAFAGFVPSDQRDAAMKTIFLGKLVFGRNPELAHGVKNLLKEGKAFIATMGSMHLPDDPYNASNKGVISLLREDGITVSQI